MAASRRDRWGFHRLAPPWPERLVVSAGIAPGDLVLDLGAGDGALTAALVSVGARVVAFELHPRRAARLRERFADAPVVVVEADVADLRLPRRPFRVVANPPFAASAGALRRLVADGSRLVTADVVVPRWVAIVWADGRAPGAARWRSQFRSEVAFGLPPGAFFPAAPVPTALLRIVRRSPDPGARRRSATAKGGAR